MKNIEFKVWDKRNNCWLKGTEEPNDDNLFIEEIYENNSGIYAVTNWGDLEYCLYIGLKDKNNQPIYEGDVMLHDDSNWGYGGEYDKKHDGYLRTVVPSIDDLLKDCPDYFTEEIQSWEVIGNIYENPELLREV